MITSELATIWTQSGVTGRSVDAGALFPPDFAVHDAAAVHKLSGRHRFRARFRSKLP